MPVHPAIACEPPASRRLRRWAPLLLFLGLIAVALLPGRIARDRPFQVSLCDDLAPAPEACAIREQALSAAMDPHALGSAEREQAR
jgi:hypothetical protein